jgi:hypothetical protein
MDASLHAAGGEMQTKAQHLAADHRAQGLWLVSSFIGRSGVAGLLFFATASNIFDEPVIMAATTWPKTPSNVKIGS